MKQRTTEWLDTASNHGYHERQWANPYRSSVKFCDWLESLQVLDPSASLKICDVGAGEGANVFYMSQRYTKSTFKGLELNPELVSWGNGKLKEKGVTNASLEAADLYQFPMGYKNNFDGVVMYQTLSWLPEFKTPLDKLASLDPKWIGLTSLFYEGDVNCRIEIEDHTIRTSEKGYGEAFYNVYSLPLVKAHLAKHGYTNFQCTPFNIDIDLPKPEHGGMGTYTETLKDGRRLQFSGPLLMSWYFVLASK